MCVKICCSNFRGTRCASPIAGGWKKLKTGKAKKAGGKDEPTPSAWAELDKLKL